MSSFEINRNQSDDFHFWIKGKYDDDSDEFLFTVYVNPKLDKTDIGDFFNDLKEKLCKKRSLKETEALIDGLMNHNNERVRELGQIVGVAADKAWVEHFLEISLNDIA